jgi:hypothetical protein
MNDSADSDFVCRIDASNTIVAAGQGWSHLLHDNPPSDGTPPPFTGKWLEVDDAIRRLKLLESEEVMRVTHSICPECAAKVIREMEEAEDS